MLISFQHYLIRGVFLMLVSPGINMNKQETRNQILVCWDILWFVREMSEFPVLLSRLFSSRFFLKNVEL